MDFSDVKDTVELRRKGNLFVMVLNTKKNRFNLTVIAKVHELLDIVEKEASGPACLVTVNNSDRIYSFGLDIEWMNANRERFDENIQTFTYLLGRLLIFPIPTIAAINGHAFAGGCMFAMAHDYRIMRTGRGFMCLPEIDLGMDLPPGMTSTVQCKCTPAAYRELMFGGRFTAEQCLKMGVVDAVAKTEDVFAKALEWGEKMADKGKNKITLGKIKYQAYKTAFHHCNDEGLLINYPKIKAKL